MVRTRYLAPVFLCIASIATAQAPRVQTTSDRMQLDGRLTESAWQRADSIDDFRQSDPAEGEPATERTVVRFISASEGLWIGIHAYDREPGRVLHAQLRRDTGLDTDDAMVVMLSPLQDKRTAFLFAVNPNGATTPGGVDTRPSTGAVGMRAQCSDGWVVFMRGPAVRPQRVGRVCFVFAGRTRGAVGAQGASFSESGRGGGFTHRGRQELRPSATRYATSAV